MQRKSTSQVTADQRSATLRELLARSSYRRTVAISGHGKYGDWLSWVEDGGGRRGPARQITGLRATPVETTANSSKFSVFFHRIRGQGKNKLDTGGVSKISFHFFYCCSLSFLFRPPLCFFPLPSLHCCCCCCTVVVFFHRCRFPLKKTWLSCSWRWKRHIA